MNIPFKPTLTMKIRLTVPANPAILHQDLTLDEITRNLAISLEEHDQLRNGKPVTINTFLGETLFTPLTGDST